MVPKSPKVEKTAPVCRQIEDTLRQEILNGIYSPHDKFLSERKLVGRFKVNDATARKAVNRLVAEGLLYKFPFRGTFIAPPRKNRMILLVMPCAMTSLVRYCAVKELMASPYRFYEILEEEYLAHVNDIELLYPEISGVLFYRDIREVGKTFDVLRKKNIEFIFYGSSAHDGYMESFPALFYDESEIVNLAMNALYERGCKNIGICYGSAWAATLARFRHYLKWMKSHNIVPSPDLMIDSDEIVDIKGRHARFRELFADGVLQKADGMFCATDDDAAMLVQHAKDAGIKIPGQLKVIGVNNSPICEIMNPGLSSVDIPAIDDCHKAVIRLAAAIEGGKTAIRIKSAIKLVVRGSV